MDKESYIPFGERVSDTTPVSSIEVIANGGVKVNSKESLVQLVEPPLLEACEELFEKNIETVMSSANKYNVGDSGYITIAFDTLSPENQEIAKEFGEIFMMHGAQPFPCINISFPINNDTTVGEIRTASLNAVSKFKYQDKIERVNLEQVPIGEVSEGKSLVEWKDLLNQWEKELAELEKTPDLNPDRLKELQRDVADLRFTIEDNESSHKND